MHSFEHGGDCENISRDERQACTLVVFDSRAGTAFQQFDDALLVPPVGSTV